MKHLLTLLLAFAGIAEAQDTRVLRVTPTVTAGAYSADEVVGGLLTFTNAFPSSSKTGRVISVAVYDKASQMADYDLLFFRSQPAGTYTDNATFDPTDADLLLINPALHIADSNQFAFSDNSVTSLSSLSSFMQSDTTTLYGVLVDRTGRTGASTSDITLIVSIEVD